MTLFSNKCLHIIEHLEQWPTHPPPGTLWLFLGEHSSSRWTGNGCLGICVHTHNGRYFILWTSSLAILLLPSLGSSLTASFSVSMPDTQDPFWGTLHWLHLLPGVLLLQWVRPNFLASLRILNKIHFSVRPTFLQCVCPDSFSLISF